MQQDLTDMTEYICPSCGYWNAWPSGDGCENMTARNNETKEPWEMRVTEVQEHEDGGATITFDLDVGARKALTNLGLQFVLHCAAAGVDMQTALDSIMGMKLGE